jgi:hypothetical protein
MKQEESKKIIKEIQFIYFMIFGNYLLTFTLYSLIAPQISPFLIFLGIATIIYGLLIILSDFIEMFYQKRKNTKR